MSEAITIKAELRRLIFHNTDNRFTVGLFEMLDIPENVEQRAELRKVRDGENEDDEGVYLLRDNQFKAVGRITQPVVGLHYEIKGSWRVNKKFNEKEIKIESANQIRPVGTQATISYLRKHCRGVGAKLADAIYSEYGDGAIQRIIDDSDGVADKIKGLSRKRAEDIARILDDLEGTRNSELKLIEMLKGTKVNQTQTQKICDRWGIGAADHIASSPYDLMQIPGVGFKTADSVAIQNGFDPDNPVRFEKGISYLLRVHAEGGDACVSLEQIIRLGVQQLSMSDDAIVEGVKRMLSDQKLVKYKEWLYLPALFVAERRVAEMLVSLASQPIDTRYPHMTTDLSDQQLAALNMMGMCGCMIVTGGPGTGKSYTIARAYQMFKMAGDKVKIATPTGKAARRISELIPGAAASTIHKLLEPKFEAGEFQFSRSENNPIEADVIILDETSMIDVRLMRSLLRAVKPGTRVILVGDHGQLQPVGPGAVLQQSIKSGLVPTVRFTEIHRQAQGSQIVYVCHEIRRGKCPEISNGYRSGGSQDNDLYIFRKNRPESNIHAKLLEVMRDRVPTKFGITPNDIQVITPVREKTSLSVRRLNPVLQELCNPMGAWIGGSGYRVGDRVIQKKNDYKIGVMNGDMGIITSHDKVDGTIVVRFENPTRVVPLDPFNNDLWHAYAITCHSAQGSEFDYVVVPLFTGFPIGMKSRSWIYTAISRAKKACILVGQEKFIRDAIEINWQSDRRTNLAAMMRDARKRKPEPKPEPQQQQREFKRPAYGEPIGDESVPF